MKVSKEQKEKTKRKLIETAVELFIEKGYQKTSMKKIAKTAGVGEATIYNYFPNKEKILLAYYVLKAKDTIAEMKGIESFSDYEIQEKFQVLIDTYLQQLLPDREFVADSLKLIFRSPRFLFKDIDPIRKEFKMVINEFLTESQEHEEIPTIPFQNMLADLICEYMRGIVFYWIKDESEEFSNTTQLVDLSLGLGTLILKSGMLNQTTELVNFLLKAQLFRVMESGSDFLQYLQRAKNIYTGKSWGKV